MQGYYVVEGISKSYGRIYALNNVSMKLSIGEIMAVVGDNGAGKSTLMKVLSGAIKPDMGRMYIEGCEYEKLNVSKAIECGISTVYQDLALVDCKNVTSNIFLGRELLKFGVFTDFGRMKQCTHELLEQLNIEIPDIEEKVGNLSGGQRQMVSIARAIHQGGKMIILDEPTAALGVKESEQVLSLILSLKAKGCGVVIVSHNMDHVFEIADRITVLRHGRKEGSRITASTNKTEIVKMITGGTK